MASCSFTHNGRTFTLSVVETSYSIANNTSNISWTLSISGGGSTYYNSYAKATVNGSVVYNESKTWDTYSFPAKDGSVSGTINGIAHDSQGKKSISFALEGYSYSYNTQSTSGSLTLTNIPRYADITTFTVTPIDETSVKVTWGASDSCDKIWYSTNNGSSWVETSGYPNFNITGLNAGTSYNFKIRVRRTSSQLTTDSGTVNKSTYDYPKPTSINDFTIGDGVSVNLYNPLGRNVTLDLISNNDGSVIGTFSGTYEGVVNNEFKTTEAINSQYASIPNSNEGTYYARVTYGSVVKTLGTGKYYTNVSECSPSFTTFNVKDNNSSTVAVTGNNQLFIKGYSDLYVTIPSANKMTTQKSATPSRYSLSCDTLNQSANYSNNNVNVDMGTIANSGTLRVNVRAYDSRSNSALAYKDITVYDYAKPVINVSASRLNNFENETTLKISGTYTKLTINNVDKNTITNVKYRYRETGGTWSGWTNVTTSVVSGRFTCNDVILSLDNTKSFEFEIQVTDNIDYSIETASIDIGQAIFFISSNNKACYINGQEILMYDVVDTW